MVEAVSIPVIANGDIRDGESAQNMVKETGCAGLMIGRAALGDPFVFERIRAGLEGGTYVEPTAAERLDAAKEHLMLLIRLKGERTGVCEGRKHMAWYTKGMPGSASLRHKMNYAVSFAEMIDILEKLKNTRFPLISAFPERTRQLPGGKFTFPEDFSLMPTRITARFPSSAVSIPQ